MALALCHDDPPSRLAPPPGQVTVGTRLPTIDGDALTRRCEVLAPGLDEFAREEPGLEPLIATAVRRADLPLSVVLPGSDLTSPHSAAALLLLWGLWRTTAPLLAVSAWLPRPRGWSFSTYEPPLGNREASDLPDVVFRSQEQERQDRRPLSYRAEITIRPRSPASCGDQADYAARALAVAFRSLDGAALWRRLERTAADYPDIGDRLAAVERMMPAVAASASASATADSSARIAAGPATDASAPDQRRPGPPAPAPGRAGPG